MKKIICLMGPTACGKTNLAVALSQKIPVDIVSVDSALVYRGMDIGTGKPTPSELKIAPHRLINLIDPVDHYSAGQFCVDALCEIQTILSNNRTPLLVGGTMLYFNRLLFGIAPLPQANQSIRDEIEADAKKIGWEKMHARLEKIDPVAFKKIQPQDPQRISRALEVFMITGMPISILQKNNVGALNDYDVRVIALIPKNRDWLHQQIALRFEKMLQNGLIDEVRALHARPDLHIHLPAMRMVGYRQVWEYLDGEMDFETMKAKAIAATRQLAKRQLTWLRSFHHLLIFDPENKNLLRDVLQCLS